MVMVRFMQFLGKQGVNFIARCALVFTILSVNSACALPYYEIKQPRELEKLKWH